MMPSLLPFGCGMQGVNDRGKEVMGAKGRRRT